MKSTKTAQAVGVSLGTRVGVMVGMIAALIMGFALIGMFTRLIRPVEVVETLPTCSTFVIETASPGTLVDTEVALHEAATDLTEAITSGVTGNALLTAANARKELLHQMMQIDPVTARIYLLNTSNRSYLSQNTTNCTETETSKSGELLVGISEEDSGGGLWIQLNTTDKSYLVAMTDTAVLDTTRTSAELTGFMLDDLLYVDTGEDVQTNLVYTTAPLKNTPAVTGERPLYVIKFTAPDFDKIGYNDATLMSWAAEADNFHTEQSWGLFSYKSPSGQDTPADIISSSVSAPINCGPFGHSQLVQAAVAAAGSRIDYSEMPTVVVFYNPNDDGSSSCNVGSSALMNPLKVNDNYVRSIVFNQDTNHSYIPENLSFVFGHEMGHTMGLHHAGIFNHDITTVPITDNNCDPIRWGNDAQDEEYSDHFDVMGSFGNNHFNAYNKIKMGWFDDTMVQTVTDDGTYRIGPSEFSPAVTSEDLRALRIPRNAEGTENIYVEFRTPYGFDADMPTPFRESADIEPTNVFDGALMHIEYPCSAARGQTGNEDALIFKPYPGAPGVDLPSPALEVGDTFTDPKTATRITVTDINKSSEGSYQDAWLEVQVEFVGTPQIAAPLDGAAVGRTFDFIVSLPGESGTEEIEYYATYYDSLLEAPKEELIATTTDRTITIDTSQYIDETPLTIKAQLKGTEIARSHKYLIERCNSGDQCVRAYFLYWKPMQQVQLTPGAAYTVSYWAKKGTTDSARIFVGGEGWSDNCNVQDLSMSWQQVTCEISVPATADGSALVRVLTGGGSDPGDKTVYSYVDDIVVYLNGENPKDSVLINGDFEQGATGWWMGDDPTFVPLSTGIAPIHACGDLNPVVWPAISLFPPSIDIADITTLVAYSFKGGPAPFPLYVANVNGYGGNTIDVGDLTYLVTYQFKQGPKPFCQFETEGSGALPLGSNWTEENYSQWYSQTIE